MPDITHSQGPAFRGLGRPVPSARFRRSPGVVSGEGVHESSQGGEGGGVGSGVQLSTGGEGGEAVEDFPAGPRGGQHPGHAFGGAGFAGGFPLHDPDGDGPSGGGPAFFVGGSAAGLGAPAGSAAPPGPVHRSAAAGT